MNRGFLIYERDSRFILSKSPTPADLRASITDDETHNTSIISFSTYEEALSKAEELIGEMRPSNC